MKKEGKRAIDVVIDSFLKRVKSTGEMPWQNPHSFGVSINWVSKKMYRGINRILLPNGEYMTKNQLNKYNEEHGTDFRFQKGIVWFPVVFYSKVERRLNSEEIEKIFGGEGLPIGDVILDSRGSRVWRNEKGYFTESMILRYSLVAEIRYFKDSKGNTLPRRIGNDTSFDLQITKEEPQKVIDAYIKRSGISYEEIDDGKSYYVPSRDLVHVNENYRWSEAKYSTTFHELAHSTGHANRLDRDGITKSYPFGSEGYAFEECVAEIASSLLCQETGVDTFVTSGTESYDNSASYVSHWSEYIKDNSNKFVSICKKAEQAYLYILGYSEDSQLSGKDSREA